MSRYRESLYTSVRSANTYGAAGQTGTGNYWRTSTPNLSIASQWNPPRPRRRRSFKVCHRLSDFYHAKIITVEPVIFLFMFAYYFYKVIFELYSFNLFGTEAIIKESNLTDNTTFNYCLNVSIINNYTGHTDDKLGDKVESKVALLTLIVGITARLPSVVASLILGPISDKFGRKPVFYVILVGMLLHAVVTIIIVEKELDVYFFILGGGLRGACGGIAGILTACYSYIADVSSKKWLVVRLGLLEAMTFAAGTLSLVTAGVWSQLNGCQFGPMAWVLIGCMLVALPYTYFLVPESLDKEERKIRDADLKKKPKALVGPKALLRGLQIFLGKGYPRCKLWLLLLVMVVTIMNTTGTTAIITLFLLHEPLEWAPLNIGLYQAASEMMHGVALIVLLPLLVYVGVRDDFIAVVGIILSIGTNVCLGFVDKTWQVYLIGTIQSIDALILPGVKALMSKTVLPVDHGALFSFVSAAQVLSSVLAYAVYVVVYTYTLKIHWTHASGISFFIMALLYALLLPVMMVVLCLQRREKLTAPTPPTPSPINQSPQRAISPPINSPPRGAAVVPEQPMDRESLLQKVQSELGQDALERRSFFESSNSLGRSLELERSLQSSLTSSARSFH